MPDAHVQILLVEDNPNDVDFEAVRQLGPYWLLNQPSTS